MPAVSVGATSTSIVAANYNRRLLLISNTDSTNNVHLSFGTTSATTNEGYIPAGGNLTLTGDACKSAVNGIASSGTITVKYSEFAPGT